jgi:DNA-binding response OmpR family regulator
MAAVHAPANARPWQSTILLVEDEVLIRTVLADDLRQEGYAIVEAANAEEALSILHTNTRIDLVITDNRMPGALDGSALVRQLRRHHRGVAVIMISGELPEPELVGVLDAYLRKPCRMLELLSHVRALAPAIDG